MNKLLRGKWIKTTPHGKYEVNDDLQVEALRNFFIFKGKLIPHLVFYGAIVAGLFISYVIFYPIRWDFRDLIVITVCVISIVAFLFEAYNQHHSLTLTEKRDKR